MSRVLDKAYRCADEASTYGASVAVALPPQLSPVGLAVGGLVGCAKGAGLSLSDVGDGARSAWRMTRRVVGRALDLFGLGDDKPRRPAPPLTTDEAMALVSHSWGIKGGGPTLYRQGQRKGDWFQIHKPERILTPSVLADLYGPGGAAFDAERVLGLWWSFWNKSLKQRPDWRDPQVRLLFCVIRTGDYLRRAPSGTPADQWPLLAEGDEIREEAQQIQAAQGGEAPERVYFNRTAPSPAATSISRAALGLDAADMLLEIAGRAR
jgi:hypothetical protein